MRVIIWVRDAKRSSAEAPREPQLKLCAASMPALLSLNLMDLAVDSTKAKTSLALTR